MQPFRRSLTGVLLIFLAAQGAGPLFHAARTCGATASMGGTCCCCRQAGAKDGCPMCKRAQARHGAVRCGCGCQGQPADEMAAPAFDPIAVLPDRVPGFADLAVSSLPAPAAVAFRGFTPIPPAPPPWLGSTLLASCSHA